MCKAPLRSVDPDVNTQCESHLYLYAQAPRFTARASPFHSKPALAPGGHHQLQATPRLPKPHKRDLEVPSIPPPRSAIGMGHIPISVSVDDLSPCKDAHTHGFSAPSSFTPLGQPGATGWGTTTVLREAVEAEIKYGPSLHVTHDLVLTTVSGDIWQRMAFLYILSSPC